MTNNIEHECNDATIMNICDICEPSLLKKKELSDQDVIETTFKDQVFVGA